MFLSVLTSEWEVNCAEQALRTGHCLLGPPTQRVSAKRDCRGAADQQRQESEQERGQGER